MEERTVGEGRTVLATHAREGGWWLCLREGKADRGRVRLTQLQLRQVVKERAIPGPVEVRGLRYEVEFRIEGVLFGRIPTAEFLDMLIEPQANAA